MTIAEAQRRVNHSLYLPAIQRPYVWKTDQIIGLFDSLMQGYPISSFLFWAVEPQNRREWSIYRFEEAYRQGEPWNQKVEPDGRDVIFVLDGQQRLTSLLIGLSGSYTLREKYGRRNKSTSFRAHHLYLDLFKDPGEIGEDDEVTANRYRLKFSDAIPRSDHKQLWIKIGDILDLKHAERLAAYRDTLFGGVGERVTAEQLTIAERNLNRLHELVWIDEAISYYTERLQDIDRVLAIFIRANEGGVKLSKADLLMSVVTTTWGESYVRDEILGLVETLNEDMGAVFNFDKDLVMRACLVISDLPNVYNVANFTAHNMQIIRENWKLIRLSLEGAVELAARFGLDARQLSSMNTLIPIAYYISRLNGYRLDGTSTFDAVNRERIKRWLFGSLFVGAFGGNSDGAIAICRDTIREETRSSRNFPFARLAEDMRTRRGNHLSFDDENSQKLLDMTYGQKHTAIALGMLYDSRRSPSSRYHVDHIIPLAAVSEKALRERGVAIPLIKRIRSRTNKLGNLQLLIERENLGKSDSDLPSWLRTRDATYFEQHLIPRDPELWEPDRFLDFIDAREDLIRNALKRFLNVIDQAA
ncbi:DUF262 domain-containing protein [Sphingomonas sp. CFBP9021]|uniref:DUF262 domain-containing protein n=1 Tax=Sphingomonas sp. CFBP9021 TaxID=3096534 RepID=UPI002A6B1D26|nr:DUF262 domain-containing protein [Sphingomonas sp. CFBP9021]MDY0966399.1 DUF262 domain-containing protein [Sphingomonas sp. CFBP9021]